MKLQHWLISWVADIENLRHLKTVSKSFNAAGFNQDGAMKGVLTFLRLWVLQTLLKMDSWMQNEIFKTKLLLVSKFLMLSSRQLFALILDRIKLWILVFDLNVVLYFQNYLWKVVWTYAFKPLVFFIPKSLLGRFQT